MVLENSIEVRLFFAVTVAPATAAAFGSVTVPVIAPVDPGKITPGLTDCGILSVPACSAINREKVATLKSSAVPSLPSSPSLRR